MKNYIFILELALAGALVGFLLGADSLKDFFGSSIHNTAAMNIVVSAAVGAFLGFLGSLTLKSE